MTAIECVTNVVRLVHGTVFPDPERGQAHAAPAPAPPPPSHHFVVRSGVVAIAMLCGVLMLPSPGALGTPITYSAAENPAAFGWLDQYSLDNSTYHFVGNEACVPTSTTNAMTYLQNVAPSIFGTSLTGTSYADWIATDALLISPAYMDTTPRDGTYTGPQFYGTTKYITETMGFTQVSFGGQAPSDAWGTGIYAKPAWVVDGFPTWEYLFGALSAGQAAVFTIEYADGGGHGLLAQGFQWTDANGDGTIQKDENAALTFVDPLDPAFYTAGIPSSGPKLTSAHIWNDADAPGGKLKFDYTQYWGQLPYDAANYGLVKDAKIDSLLTIIVPEPALIGPAGMMIGWLLLGRRRRA